MADLVKVIGIEEVNARLSAYPQLLVQSIFTVALDRAGGVIAAEMMQRAPYREEGLLKEGGQVQVTIDDRARGGVAAIGYSPSLRSERTGASAAEIAQWVELGHFMKSHRLKPIRWVEPRPFMRPAAEASWERAVAVFTDNVIEQITRDWSTS